MLQELTPPQVKSPWLRTVFFSLCLWHYTLSATKEPYFLYSASSVNCHLAPTPQWQVETKLFLCERVSTQVPFFPNFLAALTVKVTTLSTNGHFFEINLKKIVKFCRGLPPQEYILILEVQWSLKPDSAFFFSLNSYWTEEERPSSLFDVVADHSIIGRIWIMLAKAYSLQCCFTPQSYRPCTFKNSIYLVIIFKLLDLILMALNFFLQPLYLFLVVMNLFLVVFP